MTLSPHLPPTPIILLIFSCVCGGGPTGSLAFQPSGLHVPIRHLRAPPPSLTHHELFAQSTFQQQPETAALGNPTGFLIDKEEADRRALLGMPKATAATDDTPLWKIRLQLMKPITWIPLAAGVLCGAPASGNYHWIYNPFDPADRDVLLGLQDAARGLLTMILAGPFMEGYSQTINDWYDRDIDAVNEPYRPIPSGAISEKEIMKQIWFLIFGSLCIALGIDQWAGNDFPAVLFCAAIGTLVGYIYSAPPLRLKQNGWTGDLAIGLCYITLPWLCGHAAFNNLDRPEHWTIPLVYSLAGIGPAIANDFKSIEGDEQFGIDSIPVMYGIDAAKWICAIAQIIPQLAVISCLFAIGEGGYASAISALIPPQFYYIKTLLLADPVLNDVEFQKKCQPFFFLGLVCTALCMGQHDWVSLPH